MGSEENFKIKFTIKDKNGKIIELKKDETWKIDWGKKQQTPKEVVFKKDDEMFKIIIEELELWRGLLKKGVKRWFPQVPLNSSYQIYHGEPNPEPRKITNREEESPEYVRITNPLRKDTIVIASVLLFLMIIVVIVYCWYQNKDKKSVKFLK